MSAGESTVQTGAPETEGPGQALRRGREAAGLDQETLARDLRLPLATVQALEGDDFDKLPEPAYIKGYLRACAKRLKLDEAELIARFDAQHLPEPEFEVQTPGIHARKRQQKQRLASVLVTLTVVVLFSVWGVNAWMQAPEQTNSIQAGQVVQSQAAEAPQEVQAPVVDAAERVAPEHVAETPDATGDDPEPALEHASTDAAETLDTPALSVEHAPEVATQADDDEFQLQGREAAGDDWLELNFESESWAEVFDANGERLLYGLFKAGSRRKLRGTSPFKVVLGYAPGVKIAINGEPYDHSLRIRRGSQSARFTLYATSEDL